ncbi:unnamed protein product, partial [marine sediment metagenome]
MLAIILDIGLARIESRLKNQRHSIEDKNSFIKVMVSILVVLVLFSGTVSIYYWKQQKSNEIVIATKNFTEQFILGDLMAELIQDKTNLHVIKKFDLGTTAICQSAMRSKEIDIYPEYTGTAYLTVLHKKYDRTPPQQLFNMVKSE